MSDGEDVEFTVEDAQVAMTSELSNLLDWNHRMQKGAVRSARAQLQIADNYDILAQRARDLAAVMVQTAQELTRQAEMLVQAEFDSVSIEQQDHGEEDDDDPEED